MRHAFYIPSVVVMLALAFVNHWQTSQTRQIAREVKTLKGDVSHMRDELNLLAAEWAYLNRPERLRALVEMHAERLGLEPLTHDRIGAVHQIPYAAHPQVAVNGALSTPARP